MRCKADAHERLRRMFCDVKKYLEQFGVQRLLKFVSRVLQSDGRRMDESGCRAMLASMAAYAMKKPPYRGKFAVQGRGGMRIRSSTSAWFKYAISQVLLMPEIATFAAGQTFAWHVPIALLLLCLAKPNRYHDLGNVLRHAR
ncbi:hypothetical protein KCP74_22535 [Salmonella enterica subsp. enterica]|nr:hypothetical protein KCP74_22535 [Salmonella enterica subsp. enterica]